MSNQKRSLRIGYPAPNFQAESTEGPINFHEFIGDKWVVLFSHPPQNPVSSTELAYVQYLVGEFDKRNVKLIAMVPDTMDHLKAWKKEIAGLATTSITIPLIEDTSKKLAQLYDMIDTTETSSKSTVRDIFIIDPAKKVRLIFSYPDSVGVSVTEVLRVIDCLQTPENVATPVNWTPGDKVLVAPKVSSEDVKNKFDDVDKLAKNVILATHTDSK